MDNPSSKTDMAKAMCTISASLFEMRDALVQLSLSLKDMQFEFDTELRKESDNAVRQLMTKIKSDRSPSP